MQFNAIATIRTPYKQKFAIPRQANLAPEAIGEIHFHPDYADPNCLREISQFSHLWLLFVFHETLNAGWSPLVQPPRLGGRQKVGVFASRATHRPNPIGLSAVERLDWQQQGQQLILRVRGMDLLDGTPIIDIKPYLPYADSLPEAQAGYASSLPGNDDSIEFSADAQVQLQQLASDYSDLEALIRSVLRQDPRPAWRRKAEDNKRYGMSLYDLNIKWQITASVTEVLSIEREDDSDL